jgi:hypothetical protein
MRRQRLSKATSSIFNWRETPSLLMKDKAINGIHQNKNQVKIDLKKGLTNIDDRVLGQPLYYSKAKPSVFRKST